MGRQQEFKACAAPARDWSVIDGRGRRFLPFHDEVDRLVDAEGQGHLHLVVRHDTLVVEDQILSGDELSQLKVQLSVHVKPGADGHLSLRSDGRPGDLLAFRFQVE